MLSRKNRWLLVSGLAAAGAASLTHAVLKRGWNAVTGEDPPVNPASAETAWTEALTWTVAASLVAGLTRLAARRAAAAALPGGPPHDRF